MSTIRGITLYQPWATLIAIGAKTVETRSWLTSWRGPLLIHAARRWDDVLARECQQAMNELRARCWPERPAGQIPWGDTLGKAVALVNLVRCERSRGEHDYDELNVLFGDLRPGRAAWHLLVVHPLVPPIPCPGARGLWNVPPEVEAAVRAQCGGRGIPQQPQQPKEPELFP